MQPLHNIRVLDMATLAAGPSAATYLGEFGADVIKVEQPGSGDPLREWTAMKGDTSLLWRSNGRNKRSVTLNLRLQEGRALFLRLLDDADVLVSNFRPGTLEKWGLDYPTLAKTRPELIMLHITAFGRGGPYSNDPGFGTMAEAMSTFAHLTGERDGPPTLPSFPLADFAAALTGTYAILVALYHRDVHRGGGQYIDVNLLDPLARMLEYATIQFPEFGTVQGRVGNRWDISAPRNTYETCDGRWIAISGTSPVLAQRAFIAIGRDDLAADPEFLAPRNRLANALEIDQLVADWIRERPFDVCMKRFRDEGVAAAPIYDAEQLINDPHVIARGMFLRLKDSLSDDEVVVQAPVPRLSRTPAEVRHLGPALGAHNIDIYSGELGLSADELDQLRSAGVI